MKDKSQALNAFWNSFDLPAYEQTTIPDSAAMPYITYENATDSLDSELLLTASLWYRETTWKNIEKKKDQIAKAIGEYGFYRTPIEGGYMVIHKATPFSQHMSDPSSDVRRIFLNISVEFLTAY